MFEAGITYNMLYIKLYKSGWLDLEVMLAVFMPSVILLALLKWQLESDLARPTYSLLGLLLTEYSHLKLLLSWLR